MDKSEVIDHWIDTICVMTMETLSHVWSRIKFTGSYIGRLDWVGAEYSYLALTTYVFPREFFIKVSFTNFNLVIFC